MIAIVTVLEIRMVVVMMSEVDLKITIHIKCVLNW